ncbi:PP2C family protein-serine/threonine phosphatase [Pseudomonas sp. Root329]|uniref:PP2C family protein-serine/threonine phosphatase n=1 Tax=Pseudomonas sp. Root329 TaxID=1736515 RepID=UPI0009EB3886|nr:PP2C family serine/threonine-protein phosphatase [Pseudomonas sp. Root329]
MEVESYVSFERLKAWFLRKTPSSGVRRLSTMSGAIASDIGVSREENQDRAAIIRTSDIDGVVYTLVAISDGMGGMQAGGVCAATTLAAFFTSFIVRGRAGVRFDEGIVESALDANQAVHKLFGGRGGATLSALLIREDGSCIWLNIGDSRIYGVRSDGILQFTTDDTIAGQLGEEFSGLKNRSELLQFVGMGEELEPHYSAFSLGDASHFLMTTDGIHYLDEKLMGSITVNSPDPGTCLKRLVDISKWCGGKDNCSAVMFSISENLLPHNDFIGHGVCEVWDSFGDLQFSFEEKNYGMLSSKFKDVGVGETLKGGKSKSRSKVKAKGSLSGKKILTPWEYLLTEKHKNVYIETVSNTEKNNPVKVSEKTPPQLKISFPSKD